MTFIMNGQGHGSVAQRLLRNRFDPGALRPMVTKDGTPYLTVNTGQVGPDGKPVTKNIVTNAPGLLRKDAWIQLDQAVLAAAKPRLNAVAEFRSRGLQLTIPGGMGKMTIEHETETDITDATISMDGMRRSESDRPEYNLVSQPLPIIHKDFSLPLRAVEASRFSGSPLDTTTAELAAERVAIEAEKLFLGESSVTQIGGGNVYGLKNFPNALSKVLTAPTAANHPTTVQEVLEMRKQSTDNNYYGPWGLYYSPSWYAHMDADYTTTVQQTWTLRQRLAQIEGIEFVRPADYLTGNTLMLVQLTNTVARVVMGMDITTLQWDDGSGMELHFKVMAIMVPQVRSDSNDATGVVVGAAP